MPARRKARPPRRAGARRDPWVHRINVERHVDVAPVREALRDLLRPLAMNVPGRDQLVALGAVRFMVLAACAQAADPEGDDLLYVGDSRTRRNTLPWP